MRAQPSAALCLEAGEAGEEAAEEAGEEAAAPCEGGGTARGIDAKAARLLGTADAYVETKVSPITLVRVRVRVRAHPSQP